MDGSNHIEGEKAMEGVEWSGELVEAKEQKWGEWRNKKSEQK